MGQEHFGSKDTTSVTVPNFGGGIVGDMQENLVQGGEMGLASLRTAIRTCLTNATTLLANQSGSRGSLHASSGWEFVGEALHGLATRCIGSFHLYHEAAGPVPEVNEVLMIDSAGDLYVLNPSDSSISWGTPLAVPGAPLATDWYPLFVDFVDYTIGNGTWVVIFTDGTRWFRYYRLAGVATVELMYLAGSRWAPGEYIETDPGDPDATPPVPPTYEIVRLAKASFLHRRKDIIYTNDLHRPDIILYSNGYTETPGAQANGPYSGGGPNKFHPLNFEMVAQHNAGSVTGMFTLGDILYVAKENGIHAIPGNPPAFSEMRQVIDYMGFPFPRTIQVWRGQAALGLCEGKIWAFKGERDAQPVSDVYGNIPASMTIRGTETAVSNQDPCSFLYKDEYHLSLGRFNPSEPRTVFDIATGSFYRTPDNFIAACPVKKAHRYAYINNGIINDSVLVSPESHNHLTVENDRLYVDIPTEFMSIEGGVRYVSPMLHFGQPAIRKALVKIHVEHKSKNGMVARVRMAQMSYDDQPDWFPMTVNGEAMDAAPVFLGCPISERVQLTSFDVPNQPELRDEDSMTSYPDSGAVPYVNPMPQQAGYGIRIYLEWDWTSFPFPNPYVPSPGPPPHPGVPMVFARDTKRSIIPIEVLSITYEYRLSALVGDQPNQ